MALRNRYDFVLLFEVKDGNPNGDPDAGNLPRIDAETGRGLVTDVCVKRKVRNYVATVKGYAPPYDIYVKERAVLNQAHERAYREIGAGDLLEKRDDKKRKGGDKVDEARAWMCANFYDVRTFGAVMSLGVNCGQVRGPVQLTFGRSLDPIVAIEHSITRMAVATEAEAEKQGGDNRTMGRKHTVPYALYRSHGFVSAHLADQTGFSEDDLEMLWQAIENMFEHDRSAARGNVHPRALRVQARQQAWRRSCTRAVRSASRVSRERRFSPRDFSAYSVTFDGTAVEVGQSVPAAPGVTLTRRC